MKRGIVEEKSLAVFSMAYKYIYKHGEGKEIFPLKRGAFTVSLLLT
jgi:hypothetical protein